MFSRCFRVLFLTSILVASQTSVSFADPHCVRSLEKKASVSKRPIRKKLSTGLGFALAISVLGLAFIDHYYLRLSYVEYNSMAPTLSHGDKVFVHLAPDELHRGDVVVFHKVVGGWKYAKRIVGVPGDRIDLSDLLLKVNGKPLAWIPLRHAPVDTEERILQDDEYYVLGDNWAASPNASRDSRAFGTVLREEITGKVVWKW